MQRAQAGLLLFLCCAPLRAQWQVIDPGKELPASAAIRNTSGDALRIYRDAQNQVRLRFLLRAGFDSLAACPTFQVASEPAEYKSYDGSACTTGDHWVEFTLGRIEGGAVHSPVLHQLMNGGNVAFRYVLKDHGYGETAFDLTGSKRAVTRVLGRSITITPD
ncbi:MAG TPA: hypothetical protein VMH34_09085 [Gammaproteobacteria bacterium]|nr:hypothetical protein [Gammaproteobacteria bacterium]